MLAIVIAVLVFGLVLPRVRRRPAPPVPCVAAAAPPEVAAEPETPTAEAPPVEAPALEVPEPTAGRLLRLRARLARSQNLLGRGLLAVLSRDTLDDQAWDEIEEALLSADVGVAATSEIVDNLKTRTRVLGTRSEVDLRKLLADELRS